MKRLLTDQKLNSILVINSNIQNTPMYLLIYSHLTHSRVQKYDIHYCFQLNNTILYDNIKKINISNKI